MKRNNVKRSTVAMVTTLSIVALLLVSLTVAFLTDSRSTLNILGIGTNPGGGDERAVQIALLEEQFGATPNADVIETEDGLPGEYDWVKLSGVMPGDQINKDSTVKNVGRHDVYVRIRLTDENGNLIDATADPYDKLQFEVSSDWTYDSVTQCYYYTGTDANQCAILANNGTVEVFKNYGTAANPYTILVSTLFSNDDLAEAGRFIDIKVHVDAIQAKNFEPGVIDGVNDPWNGEEILEVTNRWDGF